MAANAPLQRQRVAALGRGFSVGFVRADQLPISITGRRQRCLRGQAHTTTAVLFLIILGRYITHVFQKRLHVFSSLLLYRDFACSRDGVARAVTPQTHVQTMACMHIKP